MSAAGLRGAPGGRGRRGGPLARKVVLITGASSGMGREAAVLLARCGHRVYAGARRGSLLRELESGGVVPVEFDVTSGQDCERAVGEVAAKEGRIDVLVNNAGCGLYGPVEGVGLADARRLFEVNLFGMARLTRLVLPHMREQRSGRIVNTSSVGGRVYAPLGAWYHATKHAVEGWSDCLRMEVAPFGIQVVLVEPGIVRTGFWDIVSRQLREHCGHSAYKPQIEPFMRMMDDADAVDRGTGPEILARVLVQAATARNPKRRYVKGHMARPLLLARKWLGEAAYERMLRQAFGI